MKSCKLNQLKDSQAFWLSNRKNAVKYTVQTKKKGKVFYTSEASGKTYNCSGNLIVFTSKPGIFPCYR